MSATNNKNPSTSFAEKLSSTVLEAAGHAAAKMHNAVESGSKLLDDVQQSGGKVLDNVQEQFGKTMEKNGAFAAVARVEAKFDHAVDAGSKAFKEVQEQFGKTMEKNGAFAAVARAEAKLDHAVDAGSKAFKTAQAHVGETLERNGTFEQVKKAEDFVHGAVAKGWNSAEPVSEEAVRLNAVLSNEMRDAGRAPLGLSPAEATLLAKELSNVKPGDQLVVEKNGDMYVSVASATGQHDAIPKSATVLDADALRDVASISLSAERLAEARQEPAKQAVAEASAGPAMSM